MRGTGAQSARVGFLRGARNSPSYTANTLLRRPPVKSGLPLWTPRRLSVWPPGHLVAGSGTDWGTRTRGGVTSSSPHSQGVQPACPGQARVRRRREPQPVLLWATQLERDRRWSPGRLYRQRVEGDRDRERVSKSERQRERGQGERDTEKEREGQSVPTLIPDPASAVPDFALPTSSLAVLVTPAWPSVSPHHSGWATVKRRCRRMLWFTRSFLKSPGEPRGEPRGELGPGAGAGAGGPCIAKTAWRLNPARAARDLFWTAAGAGPSGEGAEGARGSASPLDLSMMPLPGRMGKLRH